VIFEHFGDIIQFKFIFSNYRRRRSYIIHYFLGFKTTFLCPVSAIYFKY
jgi:hypothetical protein